MELIKRPTQSNMVTCKVTWKNKLSIHPINDDLLHMVTNWLWVDEVGGCITKDSFCGGFTEYKLGNHNYCAHLCFRSGF